MPAIAADRIEELETKARRHEDGARSPAGCLALAVLELAAAVRADLPVAPIESQPPARQWSTTPPTEPGWYFFRSAAASQFVAVGRVWVFTGFGAAEPRVDLEGDTLELADPRLAPGVGQWNGPIEVPR